MKTDLPPDLRARVLAAAAASPAPARASVQRATLAALGIGMAALLVVFFALGGADTTTRPPAFLATTFGGWVAIAGVATWLGLGRGGKMLGRSGAVLVTAALATGPGLLAWMLVGTSMWPGTLGYDVPLRGHLVCLAFVTAMAIGPFLALVAIRRASDPVHPRATGMALGAVAGAWAGVMGDLHCPVSDALHVGVGHVLPVLVFGAVGALLGRRVFGVRG
jgi:hypothetical protein